MQFEIQKMLATNSLCSEKSEVLKNKVEQIYKKFIEEKSLLIKKPDPRAWCFRLCSLINPEYELSIANPPDCLSCYSEALVYKIESKEEAKEAKQEDKESEEAKQEDEESEEAKQEDEDEEEDYSYPIRHDSIEELTAYINTFIKKHFNLSQPLAIE